MLSAHGFVASDTEDEHNIQDQYLEYEIEPNVTAQDDKKKRNGAPVERKEVHDIHDSATIPAQVLTERFGDGILRIIRFQLVEKSLQSGCRTLLYQCIIIVQ